VREHVRGLYLERAVVSTRPTSDGNDAIDAFHQYAAVKWLLNKPISAFNDAQWLLIEKATEEKLLEVTVSLPKEQISSLMQDCEALYLSDGVSLTAQQWNEQRKQILHDAVVSLLLPAMEKEARMLLTTRAKQWLSSQCGLELWKKVSVAPFVPEKANDQDERIDDGPSLRVLACCWGPGNPATTFVMLDAAGEVMSVLHTGYLNMRASSPEQKKRKENDQNRLLQFMRDYQPHVCVLGAANLQCQHLRKDIIEVIFKVVEVHPRDLAEGLDMIKVFYGDETIPSLYENSRVSQEQLPGQPGIVRRAVALGRFLQNPVTMVASLCGPTKEILSLKLHPMQNCLTNEELYEAIERVMVTVINQVGIDINLAASHDWIFGPLQFVAGLGPRKAGAIQRAIQSAGRVGTRKDLYASIRVMDKKVFINSAGFIRVRGSGQAASGMQHLDPLDDTRIHPESYQIAKNMAEAAFKEEAQQNDDEVDEDMLEMAVEHVMTNPTVLDTMDVEEYANSTLVRGQGKRVPTLRLIKSELQHGFRDWRRPYAEPSAEEQFYMLCGETEETLSCGRIVHATVRNVQQSRVICVLESGLLGFIKKDDLSDERDVDPSDKVSEGSIVTCRVKEVKLAKFIVDLTCKGSDLRSSHWRPRMQPDPYFQPDNSFLQIEQDKARKKKEEEKKKAFKPRMIVHPYFQNVSVDDAIKALAEKDVGDFIIRPSSRGPTHLSMTLKIHDGVFTHIDIAEGGKESRDLTSFLSLGKTLTIGEESYEDLDEVIARYVEPLVGYLREMLRYRKYKQGTKLEIDDLLRVERAANPKRIPYYFSVAHEHPGAFMLSYIRAVNPHHEYLSLSSKGFRYRKHNFDNIDKLVMYFQKHFNDPIPEAPRRAVAAMVPPRSPSSYSAGSYGYSAGSRRPSDSGGSGYDSRNSWGAGPVGNNSRNSGPGGWRPDNSWNSRESGSSGWDKGGGRPPSQPVNASSSWGSERTSSGNGWDVPPPKSAGPSRSRWDNPPPQQQVPQVSSQGGGGAWESVTNSEAATDDPWADVPSGTPVTSSGSGWDSVPVSGPRVF
jgi:transcription elongation factor SPT6